MAQMAQLGDSKSSNDTVASSLNTPLAVFTKDPTQSSLPCPYEAQMKSSDAFTCGLSNSTNKCVNSGSDLLTSTSPPFYGYGGCADADIQPFPSAGPPYPQKNPTFNDRSDFGSYSKRNEDFNPPPYNPDSTGRTHTVPFNDNYRGGRSTETEGFTTSAKFESDDVRRQFIRKVYLTLSLQLAVTFGIVCLFSFIPKVGEFFREHPALYYIAYALFIVTYIALVCCEGVRRRSPTNIALLAVFTLALSYLVGAIASYYSTYSVVVAMGITAAVCISVSLFSMQTRFDFTKCAGLLFVLSLVFMLFGIITIFTYQYSWYVHVVYGACGALLFTLFLAFDTQMVIGGRRHEIDPEEYIFGAITLYIDIVYIFLHILSLVGDLGGN